MRNDAVADHVQILFLLYLHHQQLHIQIFYYLLNASINHLAAFVGIWHVCRFNDYAFSFCAIPKVADLGQNRRNGNWKADEIKQKWQGI